MKLNDEERIALEFFGLSEDFDKEELLKCSKKKEDNKFLDAMYSEDSITDIENNIPKYYHILEFYLLKKRYYDKLKKRYLNGIVKKEDSTWFTIEVNDDNIDYLSNLEILSDLDLLVNNLYKRLGCFGSLLEHVKDEKNIIEEFNEFSKIMEEEIDLYKTGKLSFKGKLIGDFKDKINSNFERGSKEYQYMVSYYFTAMLSAKNNEDLLLIYNKAISEIDLLLDEKRDKKRH